MDTFHTEEAGRLFKAISLLSTPEECAAFFEDLCTIKEIQDMTLRFETAIALSKGANYQDIARMCGTSTATISRVSRCYHYGPGGYRTAIGKLFEAAEEASP